MESRTLRIWVIEDQESAIAKIKAGIEEVWGDGHVIMVTKTFLETLEELRRAREQRYDLIFVDNLMPFYPGCGFVGPAYTYIEMMKGCLRPAVIVGTSGGNPTPHFEEPDWKIHKNNNAMILQMQKIKAAMDLAVK